MPQKTILAVSNSGDAHVRVVVDRLKERSISAYRLDSDTFTLGQHNWHLSSAVNHESSSSWFIPGVDVIWYRKIVFPEAMTAAQSFVRQEFEGLFDCILSQYHDCRWVNPRHRLAEARPKIAQLQRAKHIGFRIPDTLVTNDADELAKFAARHQGNVIAKPIRAQVIGVGNNLSVVGTRKLAPEHYESATGPCPCYAQECLPIKSEIRVIVFGNMLHSFRLTALEKADDLKRLTLDQIRHERCQLDKSTSEKITTLMSYYGLEFGAIDLAEVDDGEPVFLELNPNGQWLWLQYVTDENLLDPFIDMLCS